MTRKEKRRTATTTWTCRLYRWRTLKANYLLTSQRPLLKGQRWRPAQRRRKQRGRATNMTIKMTVLKIATLNVNGLNDPSKCHTIFQTLLNLKCDIIALQETHIPIDKIPNIKPLWPYESIWSPAFSSSSCGTAILYGPKIDTRPQTTSARIDDYGRIIIVKTKLNEATVQITNIYAPNTNNQSMHYTLTLYKCNHG